MINRRCISSAIAFIAIIAVPYFIWAQSPREWAPSSQPSSTDTAQPGNINRQQHSSQLRIEAVVVNPYKSANIGAQVSGVISKFHYDEGDFMNAGEIAAELDTARYELMVQRADERVKSLEAAFKQADEEARLREELVDMDAGTRRDVNRAKYEAETARHKLLEAKRELELALFDLAACKVKVPFSGYLAVRYKQPDEPVDRLEKIFSIVDSSNVLAVANVPEFLLDELKVGTEAFFTYSSGKRFSGKVERVGKLIDPKSKTKRVYLLIDNSGGLLEVGMTGSLEFAK